MAAGKQLSADVEVIDLRSSSTTPQPELPSGSGPSSHHSEHSEDSQSDDSNEDAPPNGNTAASRGGTPIKVDEEVEVEKSLTAANNTTVSGDSIAIANAQTQAQEQSTTQSTTTTTKPKSKAAQRSPSPPPPPPAQPRPTIRLEITLGGPENYEVDITRLSIDSGQLPDIAVAVAPAAGNESEDESEEEEKEKTVKTKKRGRKVRPSFHSFETTLKIGFV
jgi:hypothetical protein